MKRCACALLSAAALAAPPLRADVYAWVGERGTLVLSNLDGATARGAWLAAADPDRPPRPGAPAPAPPAGPYRAEVELAAREFGVDAALLHAVIGVESGYLAAAVSPKGAVGLMQLLPPTAQRFGVVDAYDPLQNIRGGARYLRYLLDSFGGDLELALAAYNAGEGSVLRHGRRVPPFRETIDYVRKVQDRYRGTPRATVFNLK